MKRSLLKNASLCARNVLFSPSTYKPNPSPSLAPLAASTHFRVGLHSFEPVSSNESNLTKIQKKVFSSDVEDVSDEELKKRIERFYAGDAEAVPSIFEAILKRKLAGKHDEADKKVIEEICGKRAEPLDDSDDEDFDSDSDEEFGSKFDDSVDDEDLDESFHAKKNVMKKNARDE